jgi:catechol 2,3-dioxygenase-like lactoylglutathione lyase family enzyme
MMFKRIDHVEIVTDQLEPTVQFYTEVLGFTVKARDRIERSGLGVPIDLVYLDLGGHCRRADLIRRHCCSAAARSTSTMSVSETGAKEPQPVPA